MQNQNRVEYMPPRTETERRLAEIWQEILTAERVGIRERFPDLGGDSLHAIRVMNHIRSAWSVQLSVEQFLEHETVESLAGLVDQIVVNRATAAE